LIDNDERLESGKENKIKTKVIEVI